MTDSLKWYEKAGNECDVVVSTRVRLARNLRSYPFPDRASLRQKEEIEEQVRHALMSASSLMPSQFSFVPLKTMNQEAAISLAERHIVSPGFIADTAGKAVLLSTDERISIMINEEDHIRVQVIHEGFAPMETFETADRIDTLLSEHLDFAYHEEMGYLTQCPTNLGTALRVSVMLHLPALTEYGMMPRITSNLSKLGMIIRGTYGEGTDVIGAMYQLSNQVTLGLSEKNAIENLMAITKQIVSEERDKRIRLTENITAQDRIDRSAGILKSAKILNTQEFMKLISYIRLGISTEMLLGITHGEINRLIAEVQPATLMAAAGKKLQQEERDILRAQIVRDACKKIEE